MRGGRPLLPGLIAPDRRPRPRRAPAAPRSRRSRGRTDRSGPVARRVGLYQHVATPAQRPPAMSDVRLSPTISVVSRGGLPSASKVRSKIAGDGFATPTSAVLDDRCEAVDQSQPVEMPRRTSLSPFVAAEGRLPGEGVEHLRTPGYSSPWRASPATNSSAKTEGSAARPACSTSCTKRAVCTCSGDTCCSSTAAHRARLMRS